MKESGDVYVAEAELAGFSKDEISQLNDTQLNRWVNRATGSGNIAYPPGSIFSSWSDLSQSWDVEASKDNL